MSEKLRNLIYVAAGIVYFASIAAAYLLYHRDTLPPCPQIDATKLTADELKTFMTDADKAGICVHIDVKKLSDEQLMAILNIKGIHVDPRNMSDAELKAAIGIK
jgi:hypothetical protein